MHELALFGLLGLLWLFGKFACAYSGGAERQRHDLPKGNSSRGEAMRAMRAMGLCIGREGLSLGDCVMRGKCLQRGL